MSEIFPKSVYDSASVRLSTKNAWAAYVRRRFKGDNVVKRCMAEWPITDGQARGLLYGQATQNTIDTILEAEGPIGSWRLHIEIQAIRTGVSLKAFIDHEAEEAARAVAAKQAEERTLVAMAAHLPERRSWAGNDA